VRRALTVWVATLALAGSGSLVGVQAQDAVGKVKAKGVLTACVDPYNFPFSANNTEPPGFDIEVVRAIAARAGIQANYFWADTGTRGGLGRALRTSIMRKQCDFFMGLPIGPDTDEEMKEKELVLTRPYLGLGYILVVQGRASNATRLADLKNMKIGVPMSTPVDAYLFDNGYERALFLRNREIIRAMAQDELEAAMIWAPALAQARREYPNSRFHALSGYIPEPGLRWNIGIAVPRSETEMKQFLDDSIDELLTSGEIKRIVERYGMPFFPPFQ
jgi:ABC-type amino acid transport substrate-binding protein